MKSHREGHRGNRGGWLRAAVLGADDGVVSTASLMIGVAATSASKSAVLVAGLAGLVAGALSMAAGEYVSVSSQRDAEEADIAKEKQELDADPAGELEELATIYRDRGLDADLAMKVAVQLSAADNRLAVHMRDELGVDEATMARPFQAAVVSAASFAGLAGLPILALLVAPAGTRVPAVAGVSLASLAILGALGGHLGGASKLKAAVRVVLGGGAAMLATALIGRLMGVAGL
ncbi:MAG: VIT family protein [Polyangiaceae bacterium]|nr:VIT family protein [Polyangiaceae bacterium]